MHLRSERLVNVLALGWWIGAFAFVASGCTAPAGNAGEIETQASHEFIASESSPLALPLAAPRSPGESSEARRGRGPSAPLSSYVSCTNQFGSELTQEFGRLDGILESVVPPGYQGCNGDATHVHLQVRMNDEVYDVAVNVFSKTLGTNVFYTKIFSPLPGDRWAEGWHRSESLDYASTLGVHSDEFVQLSASALAKEIADEVRDHREISIYASGYGPAGIHKVHRDRNRHDGAIVLRPLTSNPQFLLFHFTNQSF